MKLDSKYFDSIRTKTQDPQPAKPQEVLCAWPGCTHAGEFKAPQGRGREGKFFMFCLAHVREYNNTYNYFSGMSDDEVAAFQKSAITGHRPTWAMGARAMAHRASGRAAAAASSPRRGPSAAQTLSATASAARLASTMRQRCGSARAIARKPSLRRA